ncbi:MAG: L-aspartate oxidase [Cyanobacteria bacterium P01_F01_bin.150]
MLQAESTASTSLDVLNGDALDVLVVGSGAAGLYATLCLPSHLQIGLVTKDVVNKGSSNWAQGGVAAAIAPTDTTNLHFEDTLKAGAGLCDPIAVSFLVEQAKTAIDDLLSLGVSFDRKNGQLAMTLEAAHSRPRVLHSADTTGKAIVSTLASKVLEHPNIHIFPHSFALNLWINPLTGCCQGIRLLSDGVIRWLRASVVILATGGGGQVFSQTTNPSVSTGDGVAMAWRAGAIVRDLEFFQFHPTALTQDGAPRFLISEAVRGEGAHLVDEKGDRFAFQYHEAGELAPRDVVSRAIFSHLQTHTHAYLNLDPIERTTVRSRFPNIISKCAAWGIDVLQEPIPIAPAAHYWMGGVATNIMNHTSIPGLYAVGEVASTGVHGANRLASNSLLECLVFASQLASIDLSAPQHQGPEQTREPAVVNSTDDMKTLDLTPVMEQVSYEMKIVSTIREQLPQLMWNNAGICRCQDDLDTAVNTLNEWRSRLTLTNLYQVVMNNHIHLPYRLPTQEVGIMLQRTTETANLLDVAMLIVKSALWRTESRGGHYRSDYPQTDPNWHFHTTIQGSQVQSSPIDALSENIAK